MADPTPYTDALAEVERLLAGTPPVTDPVEQDRPSFALARLREQAGTPDRLLAMASEIIWAGRERAGLLSDADCARVLALIAYAREWLQREAWRPEPIKLVRRPAVQSAQITRRWGLPRWIGGEQTR
jgi:hypothetical protein